MPSTSTKTNTSGVIAVIGGAKPNITALQADCDVRPELKRASSIYRQSSRGTGRKLTGFSSILPKSVRTPQRQYLSG